MQPDMRMLIVLPRIPQPLHDGGAIAMWNTITALHAAGIVVDVFALDTNQKGARVDVFRGYCNEYGSAFVNTTVRRLYAVLRAVFPDALSAFNSPVHAPYWVSRFASIAAAEQLQAFVEKRQPYDVIQFESLFTAPYMPYLQQRGIITDSTTTVLRSHNLEYSIQETLALEKNRSAPERWYRSILAKQTKQYEFAVSRMFDVVTTLSQPEATELQTAGINAVCVPLGMEIQEQVVQPDPYTICLFGALDWEPNVLSTVWFIKEVLPYIKNKIPRIVVHIGGRNPGETITSLHNGISVIVHGTVANATEFRSRYALSVVPLFSGAGIRIKILEAMALQRPVVTTTAGALGLPLTNNLNVRIEDTAENFAEACIEILQSSELREKLTHNGILFLNECYSWQKYISSFTAIVQKQKQQ